MHASFKIIAKSLFFIFISVNSACYVFAQDNEHKLVINSKTDAGNFEVEELRSFTDSISVSQYLDSYCMKYLSKSYLAAGYDSIIWSDNVVQSYFTKGYKYYWEDIELFSNDTLVERIFKPHQYEKRRITEADFNYLLNSVLTEYENIGYPFCTVRFDSIVFNEEKISAVIITELGDYIVFDSLIVKGNARVKTRYLQKYLGFKTGKAYNEKFVGNMNTSINNITFVSQIKNSEIAFGKNSADVLLYLNNNKTSTFNGIIGFLPETQTTGKLLVTGDLDLFLQNVIGRGEHLSVNWTRYQALSQTFKADFYFPYFLNSNIGISSSFEMLKQDTSYLNLSTRFGISYLAQANNGISVFYENLTSVQIGTPNDISQSGLYSGSNTNLLGIGYTFTKLDYIYNPSKGYSLLGEVSAGLKKSDSDTSERQALISKINVGARIYFPIGKKLTWKQAFITKAIINKNIYQNELFRLGGIKTFRGFDENSLSASSFVVVTSELRYLFEKNSALFVFSDYGLIENSTTPADQFDFPIGFGIGIDLQTKAGVFSMAYAYGKLDSGSLNVRAAKIHFGYIARF